MRTLSINLVEQAILRDRNAQRTLFEALLPIVHARVARMLVRRRDAMRRDVREDIKDIIQQVFVSVLDNDCRVLRQWDPSRGLSLENFVGLIAEHEVSSILRSRKRNPGHDDLADEEAFFDEQAHNYPEPEQIVYSREVLSALADGVSARVSDVGLELFYLLFVDERPVDEVCMITGMSSDAVYKWKSRLRHLVVELTTSKVVTPAPLHQKVRRDAHEA